MIYASPELRNKLIALHSQLTEELSHCPAWMIWKSSRRAKLLSLLFMLDNLLEDEKEIPLILIPDDIMNLIKLPGSQ